MQEALELLEKCASALVSMDKLDGYGIDAAELDVARERIRKGINVLDILKKAVCIELTDDGEGQPDVCFLAWEDESTTLNSRDNAEEFRKVEEWLND